MTTSDLDMATPAVAEAADTPTRVSARAVRSPSHSARRTLRRAGAGYLVISLILWAHLWFTGHAGTTTICGCGDPATYLSLLKWQAYALAHGLDPFFTTALNYPKGVNLMGNVSGVALTPVTWAFGAAVTLNLIVTLSAPLSALAMFFLLRRWVSWAPAAFLGGLFYGFSPFVLQSLSESHADLGMAAIPPLVILCLDELLVRQRRRPVRMGILLGALLTAQFLIGAEILTIVVGVGALSVLLLVVSVWWSRPEVVRAKARHAVKGVAAAAVTAVVLIGYPAWFLLRGPGHLSGSIWLKNYGTFGTSIRDLLWPNQDVMLPGISHSYNLLTGGYQGFIISPQYFGIGMAVVLVAGTVVWRHDRRLRFFAAVAVVALVGSLGAGRGFPLPWRLVDRLPLLQNIIPQRIVSMTYLAAAVMLGLIIDHGHRAALRRPPRLLGGSVGGPAADLPPRRRRRIAASAGFLLAAVAMVPPAAYASQSLPFTARRIAVPQWFRSAGAHLVGHQVVLVLPAPFSLQGALAWQTYDEGRYSMVGAAGPGAILARAGAERTGQAVLEVLARFPVNGHPPVEGPSTVRAVRQALHGWGVTTVVIPDQKIPPYDRIDSVTLTAALITAATGEVPVNRAQAWVWTDVQRSPAFPPPSNAAFQACLQGLAAAGSPAVTAATSCITGRRG